MSSLSNLLWKHTEKILNLFVKKHSASQTLKKKTFSPLVFTIRKREETESCVLTFFAIMQTRYHSRNQVRVKSDQKIINFVHGKTLRITNTPLTSNAISLCELFCFRISIQKEKSPCSGTKNYALLWILNVLDETEKFTRRCFILMKFDFEVMHTDGIYHKAWDALLWLLAV